MAPIAGLRVTAAENKPHDAIKLDTGGTTFDVSLVRDGHVPFTHVTWLGRPFQSDLTGFPSVDVKSIGAGGGSIAFVEHGKILRVGPRSAGAVPGPACSTAREAVTLRRDRCSAGAWLHRPDVFPGRANPARPGCCGRGDQQRDVAGPLPRLSIERAASAVMKTDRNMEQAIADITVNQGIDPARATIVGGGGGAAGLNGAAIGRAPRCYRRSSSRRLAQR